jgi:hypothetical protein
LSNHTVTSALRLNDCFRSFRATEVGVVRDYSSVMLFRLIADGILLS